MHMFHGSKTTLGFIEHWATQKHKITTIPKKLIWRVLVFSCELLLMLINSCILAVLEVVVKPICRILGITTSRLLTEYSAKSLKVLIHSRYTCFFCELLFMLINCCSLDALEVVVKPTLENN